MEKIKLSWYQLKAMLGLTDVAVYCKECLVYHPLKSLEYFENPDLKLSGILGFCKKNLELLAILGSKITDP